MMQALVPRPAALGQFPIQDGVPVLDLRRASAGHQCRGVRPVKYNHALHHCRGVRPVKYNQHGYLCISIVFLAIWRFGGRWATAK